MKNLLIVSLLFLLGLSFPGKSQDTALDSLLDDILMNDEELEWLFQTSRKYHILYAQTNYSSATYYAGREIGDDQINLTGSIYYFSSRGFFAGLNGAWYSDTKPGYSATAITAGYSNSLGQSEHMSWRISGDKYFFNLPEGVRSSLEGALNLGVTLRNKHLGTRLDYGLLLGEEVSSQWSWDVYARLIIYRSSLLKRIEFRPEVSIFMAAETVEDVEYLNTRPGLPNIPVSVLREKTGLLNTQIIFPLNMYLKNLDIQLSYRYNLPRSLDPLFEYPNSGFVQISIGYMFDISR